MSPLTAIAVFACAFLLIALPRRWAVVPLLVGTLYITQAQELLIGPAHFQVTRILVAAGMFRVIFRHEHLRGGLQRLDWVLFAWGGWAILSSFFHVSSELITRLGSVYDAVGIYLLFRSFTQDQEDVVRLFKFICILLLPVALGMLVERSTGKNIFTLLFGGPLTAEYRHGHYRAAGPFAHAILAGTAGAVCIPIAVWLWREHRAVSVIGLVATFGIVFASGASGPVMTTAACFFALGLWKVRYNLRAIRWLAVLALLALNVVMNDPVYYLIARIDITGGSTGYFRAALIQSAITHLNEWWLTGTDVTRHWMASGVPWSQQHTDITNYFIRMGVWGGLPLMVLFIWILVAAFSALGRALEENAEAPFETQFLIWTLGSILFAHAVTFISVSYFDQTVVLFYLVVAGVGSLASSLRSVEAPPAEQTTEEWLGAEPFTAPNHE